MCYLVAGVVSWPSPARATRDALVQHGGLVLRWIGLDWIVCPYIDIEKVGEQQSMPSMGEQLAAAGDAGPSC